LVSSVCMWMLSVVVIIGRSYGNRRRRWFVSRYRVRFSIVKINPRHLT
jgi:hypothetical protein